MTYIRQMKEQIAKMPYGTAFIVSDFTDRMDYETAKKNLSRLEKSGFLRRIMRGIYDRPQYMEIIGEYAAADINQVALALARNFNWTIAPSGNTSLNLLGLSSQVPSDWCYISTGPYRSYVIGRSALHFIHRSNKGIEGMSWKSGMLIEALKTLGKENITERTIAHLQHLYSEDDKTTILSETKYTTAWIYAVIKKICIRTITDV